MTISSSAPLTERQYVAPFILITSLFFLWAIGVNLKDILIPRFKNAFARSDFHSCFIQVAFFSGYCLGGAVLPAIMGRISDVAIRTAFVVPLVCYVYIFYFAVSGYKPGNARSEDAPSMARLAQES